MMKERLWHSDTLLAIGVIGLVLLLVIPLPPLLLDLFLSFNLALSVMALLLTFSVENAIDFSAFPSLLLFLTLFRLGLNIASTRMILTHAKGGDIIQTFGSFVTEGHVWVGLIIFSLLTLINFVVVTKGAGRVAEVAARFTLEALGGKQMAIDGEQSSGSMSQKEAKEQRKILMQEAEFYGAMDGSSKFVRGDAIASVIITGVNIIGGFFVGFFIKGMRVSECIDLYTRLTVGDGLVSQIPALLVSIGSGIIVTRASRGSLGAAFVTQFIGHPKVFLVTGLLLLILSFVPGMPLFVLLPLSLLFLGLAIFLLKHEGDAVNNVAAAALIELRLGVKLLSSASLCKERVKEVGRIVEKKLGVTVPKFRISDSGALRAHTYALFIQGQQLGPEKSYDESSFCAHVEEVLTKNAHELIGRAEALSLLERVKAYDPALVEEMKLPLGSFIKLLQRLLKEGVSIKDSTQIVETIVESGLEDVDALLKVVRERMARRITQQFFGDKRIAHVVTLDPRVEQMIQLSLSFTSKERMRPKTIENIALELQKITEPVIKRGISPIVLTDGNTRMKLKGLIEKKFPSMPVLAYGEITSDISIETIGMIKADVLI